MKQKIVEFRLNNFNEDMRTAFSILFEVYRKVLCVDHDWHFFYEGDYTFLRCGEHYTDRVRQQLVLHGVDFRWPPKEWVEPWALTQKLQDCFGPVFHSLSVLVMELFKREVISLENTNVIEIAADRVIHPFLNMATYLRSFQKGSSIQTQDVISNTKWEASIMASMTVNRAIHAGRIAHATTLQRRQRSENETEQENKEEQS